jgi:hypothetical protein
MWSDMQCKVVQPGPPAFFLQRVSEISGPPCSADWILDSNQSLRAVDIETNFGQIILDALRRTIREEIDAGLKRVAPTTPTSNKAKRREQVSPRP